MRATLQTLRRSASAMAARSPSVSVVTARAIVVENFGGPEVMQLREREMAEPGQGEVMVKMGAAGAAAGRAGLATEAAGSGGAPPDARRDARRLPAPAPKEKMVGLISADAASLASRSTPSRA